jgi:hypothetical protein
VFTTPVKEPPFFDLEYERGPDYYWRTYFAEWRGQRAAGESNPMKLLLPFVPQRVRDTVPDARLIALLRNPVDRAYSAWWFQTWRGLERRSFGDAVRDELARPADDEEADPRRYAAIVAGLAAGDERLSPYVRGGRYLRGVERYLALFPREQLLVLLTDELRPDRAEATMRSVWRFLGVESDLPFSVPPSRNEAPGKPVAWFRRVVPRFVRDWIPAGLRRLGRGVAGSRRPPPMDAAVRETLARYYEPYNRELAVLIGRDLSAWLPGALPAH